MGSEAHDRKDTTMEFTEDMAGEELALTIRRHWGTGASSVVLLEDVVRACDATGLDAESVAGVFTVLNDAMGHDPEADVLEHAFVPEENVQAVCDLLDQIQALCVSM